jgi:hypothetical protein
MARLRPWLRKLALTSHVVTSVGWLGAVVAFAALAGTALRTADGGAAQGAYAAMDVVAWHAILPLAVLAFGTGLVVSLGTEWGLFRHYWVVAKLLITIASTLLLVLHMGAIAQLAQAGPDVVAGHLRPVRVQVLANAVAAVAALLAATGLSVYKPKGVTRYGWLRLRAARPPT